LEKRPLSLVLSPLRRYQCVVEVLARYVRCSMIEPEF
jgi:hypothetical protein